MSDSLMSADWHHRRVSSLASSSTPHTGLRSRRGSWASTSSKGVVVDKETLSQVLDEIHTTASKQETLTSFSDYDGGGVARVTGPKEPATGGLAGLYNRFRQTVVGGSPEPVRPTSSGSHGRSESASVRSGSVAALRPLPGPEVRRSSSTHPSSRDSRDKRSEMSSPRLDASRTPHMTSTSDLGSRRDGDTGVPASSVHATLTSPREQPYQRSDVSSKPLSGAFLPRGSSSHTLADPFDEEKHVNASTSKSKLANVDSPDGQVSQRNPSRGRQVNTVSNESSPRPHNERQNVSRAPQASTDADPRLGTRIRKDEPQPPGDTRNTAKSTAATEPPGIATAATRTALLNPLVRVTEKSRPTVNLSRASSAGASTDATIRAGSATTSAAATPRAEVPPNLNEGFRSAQFRQIDGNHAHRHHHTPAHRPHTVVPAHLKRRVVSKEFWMKDENARDCFYCGDSFSTFRRKHHCRTCGQIFDAKCMVLVSGRPFDLPGTLRLCRPCEGVIYGSDDDSTVFSEDDDDKRGSVVFEPKGLPPLIIEHDFEPTEPFQPGEAAIATPSIGIPVSRRNRDTKRRSAVIEFDASHILARPGSSRSLKSAAGLARSSSHRRLPSRHQHSRSVRTAIEERAPFHQEGEGTDSRQTLPAFHNDNIIDPDLAAFMSDESSEEDQASLFTVLNSGSHASSLVDQSSGFPEHIRKGKTRTHSDRLKDHEAARLPPRPGVKLRKRNPSVASINFARPSPRRSRSQTLLHKDSLEAGRLDASDAASIHEALSRSNLDGKMKISAAMHGNDAPQIELNSASMNHVRHLLVQLLQDYKSLKWKAWERALTPILLQCTDDVDPDVQHGDDMDIRNYIKLKKIPGGRPGDTAYVSGVVFSKQIALKGMKRSFKQPRIVIVTFAIEYARHNSHFMSLDPILAQEREYLRNLVGRIVALRPQVLLVQKHVSGIALQMLHEAGITVIYGVKESVLAAVARVTRTIMIKSVDKLSMDRSHLGYCGNFDVKTYINNGMKRTYVFVSGCQPNLGCTIVLRGADTEALRQVKRVTEFMCYVVYNLKLETCLMRDEFVLIPSSVSESTNTQPRILDIADKARSGVLTGTASNAPLALQDSSAQIRAIDAHEKARDDAVSTAGDASGDLVGDNDKPSRYKTLIESSHTRVMSSSPFVKFSEPYLLRQVIQQEQDVAKHKQMLETFQDLTQKDGGNDNDHGFEMIRPSMLDNTKPGELSPSLHRSLQDILSVRYQKAIQDYRLKKKQWDTFYDSSNGKPFDPFMHQNIFVLQSLVSSLTSAPCAGPDMTGLAFYANYEHAEMNYEEDCTLGQFVEDVCLTAGNPCRTCGRKMNDHTRTYVHGTGQLSISVVRHPPKIKGLSNSILMWSTCRICNQETTVTFMSDNTWKYSFGKYLELSFWSTPLKPRANLCPHDIHKDFVRCFGFQDQCVRVQYDSIEIYEVVVPSPQINWAVKSDVLMKNRLYEDYAQKMETFIGSVKARLQSINLSTVAQEKSTDAANALEKLVQRADHDHDELLTKLQAKYTSSRYYEVVPLNRAIRAMDQKALGWDEAFGDFERNYFPSETDIRNLATLQLKKIFLDRPEVHENEESPESRQGAGIRRLTDEMLHSEKAQDMLSAVLEERQRGDPSSLKAEISDPSSLESTEGPGTTMSHNEVEQAVDRDDVKHLDLAVPIAEPETVPLSTIPTGHSVPSHVLAVEAVEAPSPKPLAPGLVERIEQIRAAAEESGSDSERTGDSKIPRLAGLGRKSISTAPHAVLIRSQTQPAYVPRLTGSSPRPDYSAADDEADDEMLDEQEDEEEYLSHESGHFGRAHSRSDASRGVEQRLLERITGGPPRLGRQMSMIPRSIPAPARADNATRVSALARHFEQLSREFEKERLRERRMRAARMRQSRAGYLPSSQPVVEVFEDASEAVKSKPHQGSNPVEEKRPSSKRADSSRSKIAGHAPGSSDAVQDSTDAEQTDINTDTEHTGTSFSHGASDTEVEGSTTDAERPGPLDSFPARLDPTSAMSSTTLLSPSIIPEMEVTLPKHEKSSLMKMLSSFWSERSASGWTPLDYPLAPTEHVFEDSDIIVREDEPSSVIALALSSNDYLRKLREFRQGGRRRCKIVDVNADDAAIEQAAIEASLVSETGTHMKYSFGHNQVRVQCKIFYAESFDALRRKCGVSDRFVESLSRSIKWDSKGGKTKSLFLKTLDDRFVIKSLQEVELKAFTRFAPDYFAFMSHTLFHGVPSVIAKMFGLFQVMIKNAATGVEFSSYLLVMENLFYDHKPNRRFDLKGSMRNRKIESTGQPDEVLLDENLVETIFETPLFVREHARKLVKASVWNDTMWLCKQNVMDYSLMAGFDDPSRKLFVGIIDCIRTYTWDKKLESWIKDRGKNKPTITSPKDYRNRFRVSMMQYVLQSPNVYHEFSRGVGVGSHDLKALQARDARLREERGAAAAAAAAATAIASAASPAAAVDEAAGAAAVNIAEGEELRAQDGAGAGDAASTVTGSGVAGGSSTKTPVAGHDSVDEDEEHARPDQTGNTGLVDEVGMRELHSVAM